MPFFRELGIVLGLSLGCWFCYFSKISTWIPVLPRGFIGMGFGGKL